jgi:hypothetical protein
MRNQPTLVLLTLAAATLPCPAATWIGAGDGWSWSNPDNWEGGALPTGGGPVTMRPPSGSGFVEIGGVDGGAAINLVVESQDNLSLYLNPEARLAGLRTVGSGWHQIEGTPEASTSWDIDAGGSLRLGALTADAVVEKRGQGQLEIGAWASAAGGLRLVGLEGSVVIELDQPDALERATLEATGASLSFSGEMTRVGKLVIGEGAVAPMAEGRWLADEVEVRRSGSLDLGWMPGVTANVLRVASGSVRLAESLETSRIVLAGATLEMGGVVVDGRLEVSGGWLEGGVLTGTMALDAGAGMTGWTGTARMEAGSRLEWKPVEDESAAIFVLGELMFAEGSLLAIGETDWTAPYWDQARTFAFIDTWSGGVVQGMPGMEGGLVEGEGWWSVNGEEQGGLALTWTPAAAPVPEASTLGWGLALGLGTMAARRRATRGRRQEA